MCSVTIVRPPSTTVVSTTSRGPEQARARGFVLSTGITDRLVPPAGVAAWAALTARLAGSVPVAPAPGRATGLLERAR